MKTRTTVSALLAGLALAAALPGGLRASDTSPKAAAAPAVTTGPAVTAVQGNVPDPKMKIHPKITLPDYLTVPGDTRNFVATVEVGGAPKAGFKVHYFIIGYGGAVGDATTGADGKASVSFTVPDNFKAQVWTIKASIAATPESMAADTTGKLTVIKGATAPQLGDLIWGTYKGEPGPKYGTVMVNIVQNYGPKKTIQVPFQLVMNGTSSNIQPAAIHMIALVPLNANSWTLKATFLGNESYTASEATRTYNRPAGQ